MAGPLSSERPADGAHLTHHSSTWGEVQKDSIGVYRGKSLTRSEPNGGHVGGSVPRPAPMTMTPRASIRPKAVHKRRRK